MQNIIECGNDDDGDKDKKDKDGDGERSSDDETGELEQEEEYTENELEQEGELPVHDIESSRLYRGEGRQVVPGAPPSIHTDYRTPTTFVPPLNPSLDKPKPKKRTKGESSDASSSSENKRTQTVRPQRVATPQQARPLQQNLPGNAAVNNINNNPAFNRRNNPVNRAAEGPKPENTSIHIGLLLLAALIYFALYCSMIGTPDVKQMMPF